MPLLSTLVALSAALSPRSALELKQQIQLFIDNASAVTGYSFSVGYHDGSASFGVGSGPRSPDGLSPQLAGHVGAADTMLLGSGTKPYTAAAVMRLVERGRVSLDDPAARHLDPVLRRTNGTTFTGIFGEKAAAVTVGHL